MHIDALYCSQQTECRVVYPSLMQGLVRGLGRIGKSTVDLLFRPLIIDHPSWDKLLGAPKKTRNSPKLEDFKKRKQTKTRFMGKRTNAFWQKSRYWPSFRKITHAYYYNYCFQVYVYSRTIIPTATTTATTTTIFLK